MSQLELCKTRGVRRSRISTQAALAALLALLGLAAPLAVNAESSESSSASTARQSHATPYYHYLKGRKLRLYLRADMVASIPQVPAALSQEAYRQRIDHRQSTRAATGRFVDATPANVDSSIVRLYKVGDDLGAGLGPMFAKPRSSYAATASRQASGQDYRYSEVFSSNPQGKDYRALPGGVFVKFEADWGPDRIASWLSEQGQDFSLAEKVLKSNVYLLQTPAGIEALALANRLFETGDVVYAEANWWRPVGR